MLNGNVRIEQPCATSVTRFENEQTRSHDIERISLFSDAIFAFSMTVLIVEIKVPMVTGDPVIELPRLIVEQLPHLLSFVVGFLVVAMYWAAHHRMFRLMRRIDGRLIWMNILLLMLIAFMSVPTGYLGEYHDVPFIPALYAVILIVLSSVELALWRYAATHRLLDQSVEPRLVQYYQQRILIPIVVWIVSIPIALAGYPMLAVYSWVLMWPLFVLLSHHYRDVIPDVYGENERRAQQNSAMSTADYDV